MKILLSKYKFKDNWCTDNPIQTFFLTKIPYNVKKKKKTQKWMLYFFFIQHVLWYLCINLNYYNFKEDYILAKIYYLHVYVTKWISLKIGTRNWKMYFPRKSPCRNYKQWGNNLWVALVTIYSKKYLNTYIYISKHMHTMNGLLQITKKNSQGVWIGRGRENIFVNPCGDWVNISWLTKQ